MVHGRVANDFQRAIDNHVAPDIKRYEKLPTRNKKWRERDIARAVVRILSALRCRQEGLIFVPRRSLDPVLFCLHIPC